MTQHQVCKAFLDETVVDQFSHDQIEVLRSKLRVFLVRFSVLSLSLSLSCCARVLIWKPIFSLHHKDLCGEGIFLARNLCKGPEDLVFQVYFILMDLERCLISLVVLDAMLRVRTDVE